MHNLLLAALSYGKQLFITSGTRNCFLHYNYYNYYYGVAPTISPISIVYKFFSL